MSGRIVEIIADGRPGGGTTAVLGLCGDLRRAGHDVSLITDAGSYAAQVARDMGVPVFELQFFTSRFDPRVARGIAQTLGSIRPALVHAHGARAGLPLTMLPRKGERRVYTVHGYHFLGKGGIARTLARMSESRIASRSDTVVFVSEADRDIAKAAGIRAHDTALIYNGIVLSDVGLAPVNRDYDLVFSARMHRQKNPLFAIKIMSALAPFGIRMLMIGGGELRAQVISAIRAAGLDDAIDVVGELPRERALESIRTARLFIMPSLWEGLPIAPIEALAAGLPVIGSDIAGTREVVTHQQTGLLLRGFDAAVWASAIRKLLTTPERITEMALAGRADVEKRFQREKSSAAHLTLYNRLTTREPAIIQLA